MKNFLKLIQKTSSPSPVVNQHELSDRIRENAVYDLESLCADFQHMQMLVQSVQRNYQAVLEENKRLKSTLKDLVNNCYCWPGNRCDRCQRIVNLLLRENTEEPSKPVSDHQEIIEKLRKRQSQIKA
ncbi:MAG: hypothetical protein WAN66_08990 [Limnoraphis robusta]|uniref:Uncharacterized protein n=2 Tax=Limnoraphis robusta TaxID=1118279 RepID=A0A0F5YEW1_9CYAN|nr:hypothetical protein [Limnoraphis robusta]KKD37449.1 hypothetical protein WN50_14310 [Limnoraphis robusta CS-951]MEA5500694.1 hypothetical protein [Limnoraphis robusta BA-68 BA1]MEA5518887.1 hypothetical protein [Limnoraphis robusta CCNP1315]MEA5541476.1 hypothetical protein [Limnoraphis robusta Tam1]MEA5548354.1 hypothetical protein [Limnoraphis robusta CCNP1324]